jgi:phosphohistidine phosphatase
VRLYLVRHGEAVPQNVHPERPLTAAGRASVARTAEFLDRAGLRVDSIVHSTKARARETAELLAERLGSGAPIQEHQGLAPLDPVEPIAAEAERWTSDRMLVGHLPFMERLTARLLTGDADREGFAFAAGSVACLQRRGAGEWILVWMIPPELLA